MLEWRDRGSKQEKWAPTIGSDKSVRTFSKWQKDILFRSGAGGHPWGIGSFAHHGTDTDAWVKSINRNSVLWWLFWWAAEGVWSPAGNCKWALPSPCDNAAHAHFLMKDTCHLLPPAVVSMIYPRQCDQNAKHDAGGAIPGSLWAVEYSLSLPRELGI